MSNKKGHKHSEETKKKIGKKSKGRKHTQATKRRLSKLHSGEGNLMYGKPAWNRDKHTGQKVWNKGTKGVVKGWWKDKKLGRKHRKHLSEAHKGLHKSEETKQKLRAKMLEYWRKRKKLTKDGVVGQE